MPRSSVGSCSCSNTSTFSYDVVITGSKSRSRSSFPSSATAPATPSMNARKKQQQLLKKPAWRPPGKNVQMTPAKLLPPLPATRSAAASSSTKFQRSPAKPNNFKSSVPVDPRPRPQKSPEIDDDVDVAAEFMLKSSDSAVLKLAADMKISKNASASPAVSASACSNGGRSRVNMERDHDLSDCLSSNHGISMAAQAQHKAKKSTFATRNFLARGIGFLARPCRGSSKNPPKSAAKHNDGFEKKRYTFHGRIASPAIWRC